MFHLLLGAAVVYYFVRTCVARSSRATTSLKAPGHARTAGNALPFGGTRFGDRQVQPQVPVGLADLLHRGTCSKGGRQGLSTGPRWREGNNQCGRGAGGSRGVPRSAASAGLQLPPIHMLLIFHTEHSCRQHLFPTPVPASFMRKE